MALDLYKHNAEAYEKVKYMFEKENRCAIIHPTGTGKSYIALKWLLDNKDKKAIYVTSHLAIKDQLERTIIENGLSLEKDFPNLTIINYASLKKISDMQTDLMVFDEFHRAGASKWGNEVEKLLNNNPTAKVLGLTATPVRYTKKHRDMSDEIFEGNVASHITLPKAIAEGILPPPVYVNAIYSFKEDINALEKKINKIPDKIDKSEMQAELEAAKTIIKNATNLEDLFKKYMTKKDGKYLVFCRNVKHLEEMKSESKKWFEGINEDIETYYMHSYEDEEHNKYTLDRFHYVRNGKLKLLYSVGMLNEGVHVKDIDGVIMLRPTSSPILYQQQLGRALTTGKDHKPLVFDIVNNIKCIKDIKNLRDAVIKTMKASKKPKKEIEEMERNFKIIDDYKTINNLIEELDIKATYGWNKKYELLKEYVEKHDGTAPPQTELIIGTWFMGQKTKAREETLSEERMTKMNELLGLNWYCYEKHPKQSSQDLSKEDKEYIEELKKIPKISKEKETELLKQAKKGDNEARKKLCEANLYRIAKIAQNIADDDMPFSELMSEGVIAFHHALDNYKETNKTEYYQFTYRYIYTVLKKIKESKKDSVELSDKIKTTGEKDLWNLYIYKQNIQDSMEESVFRKMNIQKIKSLIENTKTLRKEEKSILKSRYYPNAGQEKTLDELSDLLGTTKERTRQLERSALRSLMLEARRCGYYDSRLFSKYILTREESNIISYLKDRHGNRWYKPKDRLPSIKAAYNVSEKDILKMFQKSYGKNRGAEILFELLNDENENQDILELLKNEKELKTSKNKK